MEKELRDAVNKLNEKSSQCQKLQVKSHQGAFISFVESWSDLKLSSIIHVNCISNLLHELIHILGLLNHRDSMKCTAYHCSLLLSSTLHHMFCIWGLTPYQSPRLPIFVCKQFMYDDLKRKPLNSASHISGDDSFKPLASKHPQRYSHHSCELVTFNGQHLHCHS